MRTFVRMFRPEFARAVEAGEKCQTVRPVPKRLPRAGDRISCRAWQGVPYRSKQRILMEAEIVRVQSCRISVNGIIYLDGAPAAKGFARRDGFRTWVGFVNWFRRVHGLPFEGIAIFWKPEKPTQGENP